MVLTTKFFPIEQRNSRWVVDMPVGVGVIGVEFRAAGVLGLHALCDITAPMRPYELYVIDEGKEVPHDARHLGYFRWETRQDVTHVFAKHFKLKL